MTTWGHLRLFGDAFALWGHYGSHLVLTEQFTNVASSGPKELMHFPYTFLTSLCKSTDLSNVTFDESICLVQVGILSVSSFLTNPSRHKQAVCYQSGLELFMK